MDKISSHNPSFDEWNDSLLGEFLWSSVNVREAVPDVMTPSTWSLWQIYYRDANPIKIPGGYSICGNICGRPYLNLSLLVSLYRAVGKDIRKELHGDMIASAPPDLDIPYLPFSRLSVILRVLPGVIKAQGYARRDRQNIPGFTATTPGLCRDLHEKLKAITHRQSLLAAWQENIRPYFLHACRLLRSVTMSFSDQATHLRQELIPLVGEADANTLMSNMSGESAGLESMGPMVGLGQVAQGRLAREAYLEKYGHRGPHEMELAAKGSEDDPAWLEKQLVEFNQSPADIDSMLQRQRAEFGAAWQRFVARYPGKAGSLQRRLDQVAHAAREREAVRSEVTRLARLVRQYALQAGEITALGEGIFFLSLDEISTSLCGNTESQASIPARQEKYRQYSALPPYPALIIGHFDPFKWAADPNRRSDIFDARHTAFTPVPLTISGYAGAAGRVEGIVRRLDHPEEGNQLQAGEILVTVTTNIGWTPLFPRLAAIITDVGAPLSHAAIVARELGIPAVVGCGNATRLLNTGDRVVVDGSSGKVMLIHPAD